MEAALDLSARIKTQQPLVSNSSSRPVASPQENSPNQSPTSSTMTTNSLFPMHFYRSLMQPHQFLAPHPPASFDPNQNPALAMAAAFASGFLSPASAPPYATFFNTQMTSGQVISPNGPGNSAANTPPASSGNFTPEPTQFLPTASLALSTLHRRRRPRQLSIDQQSSDDQSTLDSADQPAQKKSAKGNGVANEKKDELYWERRRKNNEAAKRSRDARRAKEEEIVVRAAFLEQENLKLKAQVAVLKNETAKLHFMLLNHVNSSQ